MSNIDHGPNMHRRTDRLKADKSRNRTPILGLSAAVATQMIEQAAASPEREICGLLYGPKSHLDWCGQHYIPIPNLAMSLDQFRMDPAAFTHALFHMQKNYPDDKLLAIIHSHPSSEASPVPSLADLRGHWSKDVLIVILFRKNQQWSIFAYQLTERMTWRHVRVFVGDSYSGM